MSSSDESAVPHEEAGAGGDSESSDDDVLFKFARRRAFKRKVEKSDPDDPSGEGSEEGGRAGRRGGDDGDDASDSDDDAAFSSSPERRRIGGPSARIGAGRGFRADLDLDSYKFLGDSSDDDDEVEGLPEPASKRMRRTLLDPAEIAAKAKAELDALLEDFDREEGAVRAPAVSREDREYARMMKQRLADATDIDLGATTSRAGTRGGVASPAAVASRLVAEASAETAARRAREQDEKRVRLIVTRSQRQRHRFVTKLGRLVSAVEDNCRDELNLLSQDEADDAEVALLYMNKKLNSSQTLRQAGVPAGDVHLRLEVTAGVAGGSCGGGGTGPPITLKVRVEGGKTFTVGTTTDVKFAAFMEFFNAKVGIPPERAHESVYMFDGSKLSPGKTPEDEDMEAEDLIEARFPDDLMDGVQKSPSEVSLVAAAKATKPARKLGTGEGSAGSKTAAEVVTAAAKPLARCPPPKKSACPQNKSPGCYINRHWT